MFRGADSTVVPLCGVFPSALGADPLLDAGELCDEAICQRRIGLPKRIALKAIISDFQLQAGSQSSAPAPYLRYIGNQILTR